MSAWYCHDFGVSGKNLEAVRSPFSKALERADNFLFDMGLHPVFGIVQDGKMVSMAPDAFVNKICVNGKLPRPLYDLLPYTIEEGEELCADDFKRHLSEYVKVVKSRAPVVKRKALKQAKKLVKKYRGKPK